MSAELLFHLPPGGADLIFGDESEVGHETIAFTVSAVFPPLTATIRVQPDRRASIAAVFPALSASARFIPDRRASLTASFLALSCAASAEYASRAARPTVGKVGTLWQPAGSAEAGVDSGFAATLSQPAGVESAWQPAEPAACSVTADHAEAARGERQQRSSRFSGAHRLTTVPHRALYQDALRDRRLQRRSDYGNAWHLAALERVSRHQDADRRPRSMITSRFEQALQLRQVFGTDFGVGLNLWLDIESRAQQAIRPPAGIWIRPTEPETPGLMPSPHLVFCRSSDGTAALLFGDTCASSDTTIVVPVRRVYFVTNTQSLIRVSDGKQIQGADLRLSIDVDSWVWSWSASVPGRHLSDLLGDADEQIELEAQINGNAWRLVVERVSRDRRFASSRLAVSGRGRAAWLADPYATVRSFGNAEARLAQQLMEDALTENGVSLGWEIDWQITDWLVPAGVWSQTGTPMDACLAIAEAAGAYLQAHPSSMILRVLPRYPAAPWHWAELTPDFALPEDVCVTEGIEWVDKPAYNTVFVSGQQNGVLAHVTRAGTDGGTPAPMVTDPLISHADAGRQRGLSILSDTGRQALISLSLPVLEETGIILPGKLVQYSENGNTHLGLARAIDVAGSFPKVRQTIRLETHVI